jgi:hypothetical protein
MTEVSTSSINHDGVNIGLIGKLFENVKSGHIRRRIVWGMGNRWPTKLEFTLQRGLEYGHCSMGWNKVTVVFICNIINFISVTKQTAYWRQKWILFPILSCTSIYL